MGIPIISIEEDFQVYRLENGVPQKPPHRRNDHFLFIFQESGRSVLRVDGVEVILSGKMVICISPGQVHETIDVSKDVKAWIITAGANRVRHTAIFERFYYDYSGLAMEAPLGECFALLYKISPALSEVKISLLDACIGMIADAYNKTSPAPVNGSRRSEITTAFKRLVLQHFKEFKSAADYAELLHITPSYLNEVVKDCTGSPLSFWVQQAVVTEAKRLLAGTDLSIKEIAFSLGYDDQGYFTRYFTNAAGEAPQAYKTRNRK